MRGATGPVILYYAVYHTFQSTLLMRGATPLVDARLANRGISIHAPHARSDLMTAKNMSLLIFQSTLLMRGATNFLSLFNVADNISIHAPHARSDEFMKKMTFLEMEFQSTLLMRGATEESPSIRIQEVISIHAPHARSDLLTAYMVYCIMYFNPRSSCEERRMPGAITRAVDGFQSTLLMRGATRPSQRYYHYHHISIHAPHARSD